MAKPPILQSDDFGERPVLLTLYPTFNTERTDGVIAELDPAHRIWIFGEPHDLIKNKYRIDMAKFFAAPIMYPGDPWTLLSTFDYKQNLLALGGMYSEYINNYRIAIMPHGSKLQTLGVMLFSMAHQISLVFAMPKTIDTEKYSKGTLKTWALNFGNTNILIENIKSGRGMGGEKS